MTTISDESLETSIRILATLLTVVLGLAITTALTSIVLYPSNSTIVGNIVVTNKTVAAPFAWFSLPQSFQKEILLGLTFMAFVFPFYHGIAAGFPYQIRALKGHSRPIGIISLALLFVEVSSFYALSLALNSISRFVEWFIILILADLIWIGIQIAQNMHKIAWKSSLGHGSEKPAAPPISLWTFLDLGILAFVLLFKLTDTLASCEWFLVAALVRTGIDYGLGYKFYIPTGG